MKRIILLSLTTLMVAGCKNEKTHPATKEQRDTLMKAMTDAGYTFDFDKKELKKIEQKSIWSEEDKKIWEEISDMLWEGYRQSCSKLTWDNIRDWIKPKIEYFKDRTQPKQEWSEEDEKVLHSIKNALNYEKPRNYLKLRGFKFTDILDWLKSLRPQNNITDEELAQAKKEAYNDALDKIEYHSGEPTFDGGWSAAIWYLKKRNAQPRSQWKPSDRDIKLLRELSDGKICPDNYRTRLYEIINNLKFL